MAEGCRLANERTESISRSHTWLWGHTCTRTKNCINQVTQCGITVQLTSTLSFFEKHSLVFLKLYLNMYSCSCILYFFPVMKYIIYHYHFFLAFQYVLYRKNIENVLECILQYMKSVTHSNTLLYFWKYVLNTTVHSSYIIKFLSVY